MQHRMRSSQAPVGTLGCVAALGVPLSCVMARTRRIQQDWILAPLLQHKPMQRQPNTAEHGTALLHNIMPQGCCPMRYEHESKLCNNT